MTVPSTGTPLPMNAGPPQLCAEGLRLGERTLPLYCGAVHYFRLRRSLWREALEQTRALGLTIVETYVPWGVHELARGQYDFGEHDPKLDLAAFLDLAQEVGLYVFVRPGPNVNAELTYFGLPARVVFDPENQALSSRGHGVPLPVPPRTFPVPSYASLHFQAEADDWLRAVGEITAPRCFPNGPIVLAQVDNEAALYFRDAPYDSDYHPDALTSFTASLKARYGEPKALAQAYDKPIERFEDVAAPRRFDARTQRELPPHLDWVAHHQTMICGALERLATTMRTSGFPSIPLVHNVPMGEGGLPTTLTAIGKTVDLVGLDYYHGRAGLELVRRRTQRLAGCANPAFAPELGWGAPPWFPLRKNRDSMAAKLTALAYGLRGFNLYMTVDRDRWYGAPLDASGAPRAPAQKLRRLISALDRTQHHALSRRVEVALSIPTEYSQLSRATHMLGALTPSALDVAGLPPTSACRTDSFGFERPIQLAWHPLLTRLDEALCDEHVPFVYVESETDLDALPDLKVVFAPSYELADRARWQRLERFAARGGTVIYGPQLPTLDERLQPHAFAPIGDEPPLRIDDATEAKTLVRALASKLALARPFPAEPRPVRSTVHVDAKGTPRTLFLINSGATDVTAEVHLDEPLACVDAMTDERFEGESTLFVPMRAQRCRMLVIEQPLASGAVP